MSIIKKIILILLTLNLASCTLNKVDKVHGVSNLKNKIKLFKINETNKNDILNILGPTIVKDNKLNRWTYFEVRETVTKYGKRDIYINDYVEVYFNKYGLLKNIEVYDLESSNKIKFSNDKTATLGVKDTFTKNLFSSTRKRLENAKKRLEKDLEENY